MWSLESELQTLTGTSSFGAALSAVGLLSNPSSKFELEILTDWHRSGAETYLLVFQIRSEPNWSKRAALKACVAYSSAKNLGEILGTWIHRRQLIKDLGVATPILYFSGSGLVLEEYVEHSLSGVINNVAPTLKLEMIAELTHLAAVLDSMRFEPCAPFDDLRTDGSRIFVVDFGSDLGDPGKSILDRHSYLKLQNYLRLHCAPEVLSESYLDRLYSETITEVSRRLAQKLMH